MSARSYSFFKHQKELENKSVCNRSSGIFAVFCNKEKKINTQLVFLDYWSIKNKYNVPKCILTFRNCDGKLIYKFDYLIKKRCSNVIDLCKLIPEDLFSYSIEKGNNYNMVGTIEIEFISSVDLKIAYPAVICRYFSNDWHTTFHTSQRIMNKSSGDLFQENDTQFINEGNMLLNLQTNIDTILIISNGTKSLPSQNAELLVEGNKKSEKFKFNLPSFKPYETRILVINKVIGSKINKFLNHSYYGTVKFHLSKDVFPRMIYGFFNKRSGELSLDHTNFGKSKNSDLDCFKSSNQHHNLLYSLPRTPWIDVKTEISIPPTYPGEIYDLNITSLDLLQKKKYLVSLNTESRIKFKKEILPCSLSYENKFLPRRFHTAFMYKVHKSEIFGFFTDGPLPRESRMPGFRWAPFWINENLSYIQICPRSFSKKNKKYFDILLKLYSENGYQGNFILNVSSKKDFIIDLKFLEEHFGEIDKSLNILWVTFSYDKNINVPVFQYISRRKDSICVDHAF